MIRIAISAAAFEALAKQIQKPEKGEGSKVKTRLIGVRGMWYVRSSEFGPMPTLSIANVVDSNGFGHETLLAIGRDALTVALNFSPPSRASRRKAHKDFDGEDYWGAMAKTNYIALTRNPDEGSETRDFLGVFRVSGFKLEKDLAEGERPEASITIHALDAIPARSASPSAPQPSRWSQPSCLDQSATSASPLPRASA
jgi:hypothetical protein